MIIQRDFSMKFRSKFDVDEIKKKLDEKMGRQGLPDPRSVFRKLLDGLLKGGSWFLWMTNAQQKFRRFFGL